MKNSVYVRFSITFLLLLSLMSPLAVLAGDGKKFFTQGLKHEAAEEWDKAVEEFAKAVSDNPKNPEYRLHLVRALFNASQMYMKKGTTLANQKDYVGAYNAFRAAYGYDPVNELAKSEMERMVRLQQGLIDGGKTDNKITNGDGVKLVPTNYSKQNLPNGVTIPQQFEKLRDVPFPSGVDLQFLVKELAKDLDLNVLFDTESRLDNRKVKIELKNVTAAKALDYIFLQENLFFQKVGPRTIIVATGNQRTKFQQLVLRTFYLANADPTEVAKVIQSAIPAQPGRTPTIPLIDKSTNSITLRDTSENIKIIADLIKALDKDRAEVVMDVQIFEVSKLDLMKLGNQIGTEGQLNQLAVSTPGLAYGGILDSLSSVIKNTTPTGMATAILFPSSVFSAFQRKSNSKIIASTQIHAFNNEDSSARIGQRVPVRTATFQTGNTTGTGGNGVVSDVINYEQVGLTLKFKPIVFPNQDVQVTMEIESKDVIDAATLTPRFTERTIKGTARVQNNKTLLLASVAQGTESNGREGLPILGLIPIIGRLFSTPTKDNRTVDVVIAVTPKVIRAPAILPEDEFERPTGTLQTPTNSSLEAMIIQEEIEEQLALARKVPTNVTVQLPDQKPEMPTYVKTNPATTNVSAETNASTETQKPVTENRTETSANTNTVATNLKPIDTSVKTLQITPTVDSSDSNILTQETSLKADNKIAEVAKENAPSVSLQILPTLSEMKTGEKAKLAVVVRSATAFRSAVMGLKFDGKKVAVRSVSFGDVFGRELAQTPVTPFMNQNGKMFVSLFTSKDVAENSSGILAYIEIEALADGKPEIAFDADVMSFLTADGKNFSVKF
jgi:general secretion pathway protein D